MEYICIMLLATVNIINCFKIKNLEEDLDDLIFLSFKNRIDRKKFDNK